MILPWRIKREVKLSQFRLSTETLIRLSYRFYYEKEDHERSSLIWGDYWENQKKAI